MGISSMASVYSNYMIRVLCGGHRHRRRPTAVKLFTYLFDGT